AGLQAVRGGIRAHEDDAGDGDGSADVGPGGRLRGLERERGLRERRAGRRVSGDLGRGDPALLRDARRAHLRGDEPAADGERSEEGDETDDAGHASYIGISTG